LFIDSHLQADIASTRENLFLTQGDIPHASPNRGRAMARKPRLKRGILFVSHPLRQGKDHEREKRINALNLLRFW
jgi:hypothetical protein